MVSRWPPFERSGAPGLLPFSAGANNWPLPGRPASDPETPEPPSNGGGNVPFEWRRAGACHDAPMEPPEREYAFDTIAVHAGAEPDPLTGALAPPIYQTSTYAQDGVGRPRDGYEYARAKNPTRERLERAVAALEGGRHGIAFASGSAATAALAELAGPGDEMIVGDDVYGGTYRYLERVHRPHGVGDALRRPHGGPDELHEALNERTRVVWFETPTNPLLKVVDIAAVAGVVRDAFTGGGRPRIVVDNTFATPALQRPLELGADITFHSSTKYLAGHSDTLGGVVVTNDDADRGAAALPAERDGRRARTARLLPRPARPAHAASPHGAAHRERSERLRPFSAPATTLNGWRTRAGAACCRSCRWRGGRHGRDARERAVAICEGVRLFTLAESLGSRRVADRAAGGHDPRFGRGDATRGARGARAPVGRDRGRRRPRWPTSREPSTRPELARSRSPDVRNLMVRRLRSGFDPSALPCPDTTVEADSSACPRAAVHARPVDRLRSPAPRSPS